VGVVKRRVLRGLWRRLVGVGIIGPVSFGTSALIMLLAALRRLLWRGPVPQGVSYVQVSGLGAYVRT
jgi:hypothetical protein